MLRQTVKSINTQNYRIAVQYENTQNAIKYLIEKGVTVLSVSIGGDMPVIKVMGTEELDMEGKAVSFITGKGPIRQTVKFLKIHNCHVKWHCKDSLH